MMVMYLTITMLISCLASTTSLERSVSVAEYLKFGNRGKRSAKITGNLVFTGRRALKQLLDNTKKIGFSGAYRQYVKEGGLQQALNDFNAVKPAYVHNFAKQGKHHGKIARVGDREIVLRYDEKRKFTTLDILKMNPEEGLFKRGSGKMNIPTDRILYINTKVIE